MSDLALDLLNVAQPSPSPASFSYSAGRGGQESFDDCLCRAQSPAKPASDEDRRPNEQSAASTTTPQDPAAQEAAAPDRRPSDAGGDGTDDAKTPVAENDESEEPSAENDRTDESAAVVTAAAIVAAAEAPPAAEVEIALEDEAAPERPVARPITAAKSVVATAASPLPTTDSPAEPNGEGTKSVAGDPPARTKPTGEVSAKVAVEPLVPTQKHQPRVLSQPADTAEVAAAPPGASESKTKRGGKVRQSNSADADGDADVPTPVPYHAVETAMPADSAMPAGESAAADQRGGQEGHRPKVELRGDVPPSNAVPATAAAEPASGDRPTAPPSTDAPLGGLESRGGPARSAAPSSVAHGAPAGDRTLTDVERARFVQRVARAFQAAGDGGTLRLRLSPPELGALRLEVAVRDGVMHARLEAESSGTRALLLESLPALRERLAQQDIRLERFDVDLKGGSAGGLTQQAGDDRGTNERQSGGDGPVRPAAAPPVANSRTAAASVDGRLNVVI